MPSLSATSLAGYQAALQGPAYFRIAGAGLIRIAGRDQVDFLQRQSSNDLRRLSPSQSVATVLTSATARIIDLLRVLKNENDLDCLTLPGYGAQTAQYLRSRIFFMDQVTLSEHHQEIAHFDLLGRDVTRLLEYFGWKTGLEVDQTATLETDQFSLRLVREAGSGAQGLRALVPVANTGQFTEQLAQSGAVALDEDSYAALRIEAGYPAAGAELVEAYTPLEAGLQQIVSGEKGCYTGQEVLARQITYDKVTQSLVGLVSSTELQAGDQIVAEKRTVGTVTSAVLSPRLGPIALAIIKKPHHQTGTQVAINPQDDRSGYEARVTDLPFSTG